MSGELLLRWREADDRFGNWRTSQVVDGQNLGFFETGRYLLVKPFAGAQFYIDDEPLPDDRTDRECWLWEPGFYAGEVTAELTGAEGARLATYLLDVAPDPRKLGREVFATMVRELWEEDPTLVIGEEPAMTASGEMGDEEDPCWLSHACGVTGIRHWPFSP